MGAPLLRGGGRGGMEEINITTCEIILEKHVHKLFICFPLTQEGFSATIIL